jgi:hypothetical protein
MKNLILILLLISSLSVSAKGLKQKLADLSKNTGVSSAVGPSIPEPMVFDLVRPLGAEKGEIEINTLGLYRLRDSRFNWGPEIEMMISNGLGIEFEVPFDNHEMEELKLAIQGTISRHLDKKFIQGWQTIQKARLQHKAHWQMDYLYLYGIKFNPKWSALGMIGVRQDILNDHYATSLIKNFSLFRSLGPRFKLGVETNYMLEDVLSYNGNRANQLLVMPQAHMEIGRHYSIQFGAGFSREDRKYSTVFGTRLIFEI